MFGNDSGSSLPEINTILTDRELLYAILAHAVVVSLGFSLTVTISWYIMLRPLQRYRVIYRVIVKSNPRQSIEDGCSRQGRQGIHTHAYRFSQRSLIRGDSEMAGLVSGQRLSVLNFFAL